MIFDPSSYGAPGFEAPEDDAEIPARTEAEPLPEGLAGLPFESDEGDLAEQLLVVEDSQDEYR